MKKCVAILLVVLLLFSSCAAPAEEEFTPNDAPIVSVDAAPEKETPAPEEETPEEETPKEETPAPEEETPAPEETPTPEEETPAPEEEAPAPEEFEPEDTAGEFEDYTTTCMTFNVLERNTGGSTAFALPDVRAPWILQTILKYETDLMGLQEVTMGTGNEVYDMYTYLTTNLAKKGYECSGLMDSKNKAGSTVGVGNYTIGSGLLIFWKKDRFELKDYGARVYSNDSGRHFQWVKLYDKKEGITILMTNTHMSINPKTGVNDGAKGDANRAQQANELYQFWYANCKEGMALYATGDYNHKTNSPAFANLTKGRFVSTRDISQNSDANSGIDHVFINGDVQDCFKFHRCTDSFEPAGVKKGDLKYRASDHYAIVTYCSNAYR